LQADVQDASTFPLDDRSIAIYDDLRHIGSLYPNAYSVLFSGDPFF